MTFSDARIDIRNLQLLAFGFLMFWSLTGSAIFLAGFPLVFSILGYSLASIARDATSKSEIINPFRQTIQHIWTLFSHAHLVVLATIIWIFVQPTDTKDAWIQSGFSMSTGLGNWSQISRPENIFSFDSQTSPFTHLWLLNVMLQLTILTILVLFLLSLLRGITNPLIGRVGVVALFAVSGYLLFVFNNQVTLTAEFFLSTWSWLGALTFGSAVAFLQKRIPESRVAVYGSDSIVLIVFIFVLVGYFNMSLLGGFNLYLPLFLVLVLVLASRNETYSFRILSSNVVSTMARFSFGTFLWHLPLTQAVKQFLGVEVLASFSVFGVLLVSVGLSFISTLALERLTEMLQRLGGLRQWSSKVAVLTVVPLALFFIQTPVSDEATPKPTPTVVFSPQLDEIENDIPDYLNDPDCTVGATTCVYGNKKSKTHIVLFGNALSGNWQPALAQIAEDKGWKLEVRINPDCPTSEPSKDCKVWLQQTKKYILLTNPDMVVTNFNSITSSSEQGIQQMQSAESLNPDVTIFEQLIKNKIKAVLLRGAAQAPSNPVECLRSATDFLQECVFSRADAYFSKEELERRLVFMATGVEIVDVTDMFCNNDVCYVANENASVIYRTSTLITKTFSVTLADALFEELEEILNSPISTRPFNCRIGDRRPECRTETPNSSATK